MRGTPFAHRMPSVVVWIAVSAIPVAWLEAVRLAAGSPFTWGGLVAHWALAASLLSVSRWMQPQPAGETSFVWPWPVLLIISAGGLAALLYAASEASLAAWAVLGILYPVLLGLEKALTSRSSVFWRWAMRGLLVVLAGAIPVVVTQIESRFSEEEFFVALQVLALGIFYALMLLAQGVLARRAPPPARPGLRIDRRWLALAIFLLALAGLYGTVRAYQRSFYPPQAPIYEGIAPENPFICGQASPDPQTYDGEAVFQQLLARVAANPDPGPPEYGMLALGTSDLRWAEAFREALLSEATEGRFTDPAHSLKSAQRLAAFRGYYLARVVTAFPDLFSHEELDRLEAWFAAINRRALTVEPVDWMYGLAFSKWPEGPYENQEIGAGLLALLETEELATSNLSLANRDYLERNRRGWTARFRNTDDVFSYQIVWLENAYFQSLYTGEAPREDVQLSFEWLLLQAPSDGMPLQYNQPLRASLAGIAYLGALLLDDPRYVWIAGRALDYAEAQGTHLSAQPGAEQLFTLQGRSPTDGSCLIYGDSGLPNQMGPLAPDKIVFRDGWSQEAAYLLLNLRFAGWHRYKATNTVTLVYQGGPLAAEVIEGKSFSWLPEGRSLFRDKRIPRENLNGLLIERSGMSAVVQEMTGVGGTWAQDPPFYTEVLAFETGDSLDWSHTRMQEWRGWQHDRWIYFYHDNGPIIVVDEAQGPEGKKAALAWHLAGDLAEQTEVERITLLWDDQAAELVLLPLDAPEAQIEMTAERVDGSGLNMVYHAPPSGRLQAITVFLPTHWVGARVEFHATDRTLLIMQEQARITLPLQLEVWEE